MGVEIGQIAVIVFGVIRLLNNCYVTNSVYTCNYMIHMLIQVSNNFLLDDENQQLVLIYLTMNIYPSIQSHKQCVSNKVTHQSMTTCFFPEYLALTECCLQSTTGLWFRHEHLARKESVSKMRGQQYQFLLAALATCKRLSSQHLSEHSRLDLVAWERSKRKNKWSWTNVLPCLTPIACVFVWMDKCALSDILVILTMCCNVLLNIG